MNANQILPITLALALLAVVPTAVSADPGGHGHGNRDTTHQQQNRFGYNRVADDHNGNNGNNGEQGDDNNNGYGCNNSGGNQNGGNENNGNQNGGYSNGGYPNGGCSNNPNGNQLQGIIASVHGTTVTILRGLIPMSFDASAAINNRNVYGGLYATRSITAYGYYDSNNYFHATSIR